MPKKQFPLYVPAIVMCIAAAIFGIASTSKNELKCSRASGTCVLKNGVLGGNQKTFKIADVKEVRYLGKRGKYGGDGAVAMVFQDGSVSPDFGYADDDVAKARTEEVRAFIFAGQGETYDYVRGAWSWMMVVAIGLVLSALSLVLLGHYGIVTMAIGTLTIAGAITSCVRS